ncbi:MAG: alginate export family protein [Planctomycetota bacterium]|nr:alginate export family protein [Planctomycetota bacterium]
MKRSAKRVRGICWRVLPLFAVAAISAAPALGQDLNGARVYSEQLRVKLDEQLPEAREMGFDAGGWFSFALFSYDDEPSRRDRTLRQYQIRTWASMNLRGVHRAYVRGLLNWDCWNSGDNPAGGRGDDFDGEIERAWYQFDLGRWLQHRTGQKPPVGFKFKIGRQFATIGTALTLSMPLDMIRFDVALRDWQFMAMLGQTIRDSNNVVDNSSRVAGHQDRCFFGFELVYTGFGQHRPFVYYLDNQDNTRPDPPDPTQGYEYTSRYVGIGSEGTVLLPDLRYRAEVVGESGKRYSDGIAAGRDHICAMAVDVMLEYLFRRPTRPKVMVEYLYGSGDSDHVSTATSTVGGNWPGTRDTNFNAFGFRDTGIAFAPRISNIHIYVLGTSFFPLEHIELFKKMEIGSKVFFYHKARASGPIGDSSTDNRGKWLGWEWDIYCNWRVTSDLAWTIRYGAFQPGSAYDGQGQSCRQYLYTGITLSF